MRRLFFTIILFATLPAITAQPGALILSPEPTVREISRAMIAGEPLVATPGPISSEDDSALTEALMAYSHRVRTDDASALESFLNRNPKSRWRISILAGLGTNYLNAGYFSKALAAWEEAWMSGKQETGPEIRRVVTWVGARLAKLNAQLGRADRIKPLLEDLRNREISGPATELFTSAAEGLWSIENRPEEMLRCGPTAASIIYRLENPKTAPPEKLQFAKATAHGTSLSQLAELMSSSGLNYQMAKRQPGTKMVTPCIIN